MPRSTTTPAERQRERRRAKASLTNAASVKELTSSARMRGDVPYALRLDFDTNRRLDEVREATGVRFRDIVEITLKDGLDEGLPDQLPDVPTDRRLRLTRHSRKVRLLRSTIKLFRQLGAERGDKSVDLYLFLLRRGLASSRVPALIDKLLDARRAWLGV